MQKPGTTTVWCVSASTKKKFTTITVPWQQHFLSCFFFKSIKCFTFQNYMPLRTSSILPDSFPAHFARLWHIGCNKIHLSLNVKKILFFCASPQTHSTLGVRDRGQRAVTKTAKCALTVTHLATARQTSRWVWLTPWPAGFVFFWRHLLQWSSWGCRS